MTNLERALRAIDEGDCEHRSHVVVPWVVKAADRIAELEIENTKLRKLLADSPADCPYCGLSKADMARCASGFPGCGRADDMLAG